VLPEEEVPVDTAGETGAPADSPAYVQADRYELEVNGIRETVEDAWLGETLLFVLRERLGLPGSKNACEQGECGSCSVLLDGVVVCACLVLAVDAIGSHIQTVEGLTASADVTDIQSALVASGGVQCGFCTPGFVVAVHELLRRSPDADEMEVREALSGNLCRCTGYGRILEAVRDVQRSRAQSSTGQTLSGRPFGEQSFGAQSFGGSGDVA
jgi:carbon-monoxide dehydrogenase small subunit